MDSSTPTHPNPISNSPNTSIQTQPPPQIITSASPPPSSPGHELEQINNNTNSTSNHFLSSHYHPRLQSINPNLRLSPSSSTPELRRHSSPPQFELMAKTDTITDHSDHHHETSSLVNQPHISLNDQTNSTYDHHLLTVNPIDHHSSKRLNPIQQRPNSSASHYYHHHHQNPIFHLSSAQTDQTKTNSHSLHSFNNSPTPIAPTAALALAAAATGGVPMSINRPGSIAPSIVSRMPPTNFKDISVLYQVVAERRTAFDNLLWQVPATSLTAHAFLFSISLAADTGRFARIASMSLCIVITILTLHLFTRQLQAEDADHRWLADFEERHQIDYFDRAHGARWKDYRAQKPPGAGRLGWLAMHRSYPLWSKGMLAIGALAFAILILAIFHEAALVGYNCQLN
ncbi:hypothetical protein CROQUDRAFT_108339 [Cronartium quercuum f. sp. fusiforme G11]|uniref:Uncharacterized protein n=1 Tax=Cronartium quercuum f. sp. fusiforme G11 TaxID=708437 RepID=A0A9P6NFN6_9BASI|nr:hypothetical protein CROQUDRAFT_108339 [Cronartium quercuum f. sp. fusiforme G11]